MTRSRSRQATLALIKRCWILLVLAGLSYYLWNNGQQMIRTLFEIPTFNLLSALGCILFGKLTALYLMRASLQLQNSQLKGWRENLWVYASSDAAKYMPGGVWAIVGRIVHYRNHGMTPATISKTLLLENFGFAITAVLLSLPIGLMLLARQGWPVALLAVLICATAGLALAASVLLAQHFGLLSVDGKSMRITFGALTVMLLGWIAMGTSFFLLVPGHNNIHHWLWSIGAYTTAFITGMAAIFAPAGAGVREGVLALAGQFSNMPTTLLLGAAILNRVIWVVADLCVFSFALLVRLYKK
ncbi:hypothetical protein HU751_005855 [Pseudomonas sp. BW13M1]|uniref:Lysylphosphatidylglycerol synthetase family protein n=1 Tax=Pseudomonas peradeniyensis TaxID=2745488 RepID=A0A923G7Z8_9PSED|nr:hypothetical protein [Pseudomonas peradeniyensis]MBV4504366.1 hypothetical protein [Pseudomonas peradeniyensis]